MSDSIITPEVRTSVRQMLTLGSMCPPEFTDQVTDIACHAVDEAYFSMQRVLSSAPDQRITVTATGIAASLLKDALEGLEAYMREWAAANGLTVVDTQITPARETVQ